MGPDTEYSTRWVLETAAKDMFSEYGEPIAVGEKYWQKYIRFYSDDGLSEAYETRRLTEKEYFVRQLKGNMKDTKGIK